MEWPLYDILNTPLAANSTSRGIRPVKLRCFCSMDHLSRWSDLIVRRRSGLDERTKPSDIKLTCCLDDWLTTAGNGLQVVA